MPLPSRFLSARMAISSCFISTGNSVGRPMQLMTFRIRSAVASSSLPARTAASQTMAMPAATASPWERLVKLFSIAWANVWPRLSLRRSPRSRWSCSTIAVFTRMERMMSSRSRGASERISSKECLSTMEKSSASPMMPAFITSARPAGTPGREGWRAARGRRGRIPAG